MSMPCPVISSSRTRGMFVSVAVLIVYTTMLTGRLVFLSGNGTKEADNTETTSFFKKQHSWKYAVPVARLIFKVEYYIQFL